MKALGDRSVDPRALHLSWSPGLDLVAVALENGLLTLFRLNWQRVWTWKPSSMSATKVVSLIEWRPDGKVFVFVHNDYELHLMHVDQEVSNNSLINTSAATHTSTMSNVVSAQPMYTVKTSSPILSLFWIALEEGNQTDDEDRVVSNNVSGLKGGCTMRSIFEKLPSLDNAFSVNNSSVLNAPSLQSSRKLDAHKTYLLLIATADGKLSFYINGYLCSGSIDLAHLIKDKELRTVRNVALGNDLTTVTVVCVVTDSDGSEELLVVVINLSFLAQCRHQLHSVAKFYASLHGLDAYMDESVHHLQEAFSEMVLELDAKLTSYRMRTSKNTYEEKNSGKKVNNNAMAADFMDLLVFGHTSVDLKSFLAHELTEKGLKKLEQSVETSYNNLLKLITNYLNSALNAIAFFIMHMLAKTKACPKYALLGLAATSLSKAQSQTISLLAKCEELQTVICESAAKFNVFFKWLKAEMLRNEEKQVPEELAKVSHDDMNRLVEIIGSFDVVDDDDEKDSEKKSSQGWSSSLDQVGQYLKNKKLDSPVDRSGNPWSKFLKNNVDLVDLVVEVNEESSLIQEHQMHKQCLNNLFKSLHMDHTNEAFILGSILVDSKVKGRGVDGVSSPWRNVVRLRNSDINTASSTCGLIVFPPSLESDEQSRVLSFKVVGNNFSHCWLRVASPLEAFDAHFYTNAEALLRLENVKENQLETQNIWHLNLDDDELSRKAKISKLNGMELSRAEMHDTVDLDNIVPKEQMHRIEGMHQLSTFTCSGGRKVSAFVFASGRRVRIYDMEVDIEDEDEDELEDEEEAFDVVMPSSELNTSG